jgi:DNA-3-methyladenine glycosylase II
MPEALDERMLAQGIRFLVKRDPDLAEIVSRLGSPPLWSRPPGFDTLIQIILEQQVSLSSARAAYHRLLAAAAPLTPQRFLEFDGPWTVNIYLLMALGRPDAWPTGDLALATAVHHVKKLSDRPSQQDLNELSLAWQPWRAVAARVLWHHYLNTKRAA